MSYFNKKEQVLDIQLTQYGKHLLSTGKLNPTYYRFFDDCVLYDRAYTGATESQNRARGRIVSETPYKRTQHNYIGVETEITKDYNERQKPFTVAEFKKINILSTPEREYVLNRALGTSDMGQQKTPRFNLQFLNGKIGNFSKTLKSEFQDLPIPQIDMELCYKTMISNLFEGEGILGTDPELASPVFDDGTTVIVKTDNILGLLVEDNVNFTKENFEIEVFEVVDVSGSKGTKLEEDLRPLKFARNRPKAVVNGILLDREEIKRSNDPLTPEHVEYFFDVLVDDEISEALICDKISKLKSKKLKVALDINCPDLPYTDAIANPYSSEIDLQDTIICEDDD